VNNATIGEKPAGAVGQRSQRQPHVAAVVEHHRRHERPRVRVHQPRERPRQQSGAEHDTDAAHEQHPVRADVEILAGECGKDESRREHVHADSIDERHVRLHTAREQPAERDDAEDRQDDAEDSL
jgi:hypothetical protein